MGEFRKAEAGTEIGKKPEVLAERQKSTALGLLVRGEVFPLGAANRSEQDRIALLADAEGLCGKGLAGPVDRRAADEGGGFGQRESEFLLDDPEDLGGLGHDFGSDAVSGEYCDAVGSAHGMMGVGGVKRRLAKRSSDLPCQILLMMVSWRNFASSRSG